MLNQVTSAMRRSEPVLPGQEARWPAATSRSRCRIPPRELSDTCGRAWFTVGMVACRIEFETVPRSARRCFRVSVLVKRGRRVARECRRLHRRRRQRDQLAPARPRRPRRALQRFRRDGRRQAQRPRPATSACRRARLDQYWISGAVARPVILLLDGDQLPQPRPGPGAGGLADAASGLAGRAGSQAPCRSSRRTH